MLTSIKKKKHESSTLRCCSHPHGCSLFTMFKLSNLSRLFRKGLFLRMVGVTTRSPRFFFSCPDIFSRQISYTLTTYYTHTSRCSPSSTVFTNGTEGSRCQDQHETDWHCNHLYSTGSCQRGMFSPKYRTHQLTYHSIFPTHRIHM